jgi:hypothetical protein
LREGEGGREREERGETERREAEGGVDKGVKDGCTVLFFQNPMRWSAEKNKKE